MDTCAIKIKSSDKIFEVLSKGNFLNDGAGDSETRTLYSITERYFTELRDLYAQVGFYLESGEGYFYFSYPHQNVSDSQNEKKIESLYKWIDVLDFFKAHDSSFGPGYQFRKSELGNKEGDRDLALSEKISGLKRQMKATDPSEQDIIEMVVKMSCDEGFLELVNGYEGVYKVLPSFSYLEKLVESINISPEIEDEATQ